MDEHLALLEERGMSIPDPPASPRVVIQNEEPLSQAV